jgi:hypothetical protein
MFPIVPSKDGEFAIFGRPARGLKEQMVTMTLVTTVHRPIGRKLLVFLQKEGPGSSPGIGTCPATKSSSGFGFHSR